ncbi:MAG: BrnA antitoxin family protein [Deltaproteobacteria bacterium]|nr:BrnA antitoxin family protein [Deltaproteobacteria bacterium]
MKRKVKKEEFVAEKQSVANVGVYLRIPKDVLDWFKRSGRGYQTRIIAILKDHVEEQRVLKIRCLQKAQDIYSQYHTKCFWHMKPDLTINEENVAMVISGLRHFGGHEGWRLAAEIENALH